MLVVVREHMREPIDKSEINSILIHETLYAKPYHYRLSLTVLKHSL